MTQPEGREQQTPMSAEQFYMDAHWCGTIDGDEDDRRRAFEFAQAYAEQQVASLKEALRKLVDAANNLEVADCEISTAHVLDFALERAESLLRERS